MSTLWSRCEHRCVPKAAALFWGRQEPEEQANRAASLGWRPGSPRLLGQRENLAVQTRGPNHGLCGKRVPGPAGLPRKQRPGRPRQRAGLTASLRRRGRPHAPAAPPAPHSSSEITHTCAGKQARQPPGAARPGRAGATRPLHPHVPPGSAHGLLRNQAPPLPARLRPTRLSRARGS